MLHGRVGGACLGDIYIGRKETRRPSTWVGESPGGVQRGVGRG